MDKLDAMQIFVRVAEAGSFTAVADQLQVARSAITRQIAALEKHLRVKLITRSTRSLTLTAAGAAYLEKCRVILNMVDAAESKVCIAMLQIDKIWDQLFPTEQERIVRLLIKKVVVTPHNIEVQFMPNGLERLAAELNLPAPKEAVEVAA